MSNMRAWLYPGEFKGSPESSEQVNQDLCIALGFSPHASTLKEQNKSHSPESSCTEFVQYSLWSQLHLNKHVRFWYIFPITLLIPQFTSLGKETLFSAYAQFSNSISLLLFTDIERLTKKKKKTWLWVSNVKPNSSIRIACSAVIHEASPCQALHIMGYALRGFQL